MLSSRYRIAALLVSVFAIFAGFLTEGTWIQAANPEKSAAPQITARISQSGRPWLNLQDGYESKASYQGTTEFAAEGARSTTLFSADVNRDGFPDLVSGYAANGGGLAVIRFGDPEAFGPTRTETIEGIKKGIFPAPFLTDAQVLTLPEAADFLAVGDFDRDGNLDILTAARGSSDIYLFSNDPNVEQKQPFGWQRKLALPGQITTLATGRDSTSPYDDLAVGIMTGAGAQIVFYSTTASVFEETPAVYNLTSPATSIAINQLDNKVPSDLAVTTASDVLVIHGSGAEARSAYGQDFYQSQIENLQIPAQSNVVVGDFIPDRENWMELAVLSTDGAVHVQAYGTLDTRPFTAAEMLEKRKKMAAMRKTGNFGVADYSPWQAGVAESWSEVQTMSVNAAAAADFNSSNIRLASGNIAASAGDELIVVNSSAQKVEVLLNDTDLYTGNLVSMQRSAMSIDTDDAPIAAVPMRLGVMAQPGLALLSRDKTDPIALVAAPEATFTVTTGSDVSDTTPDGTNNSGSLREAIQEANGNGVAADMVAFSNNAPTLTLTGADNSSNAGDLDINGSVTVMGNGAGTTIISTTYTASGTNDHKIYGVNQDGGVNGLSVGFTGVTLQNGVNRATCGTFQETGGAGDFYLTGTGNSYSLTNVVVRNSSTTLCTASHGGGINVDSTGSASVGGPLLGTVTITGATISGNRSDAEGGGLNLAADKHDVVITSSTIGGALPSDGNQAQSAFNGNGGGIDIEHSFGGTVTINGTTTIQNNTAARAGGGVVITFNPNVSITGATISNNTSNSSGSGSAAGGGVVINPTGVAGFTPTITISNSTINNNVATNGATGQGGGVYFNSPYSATISNSTISGNSADRGAGVFNAGSSATPAATLTISGTTTVSGNTAGTSGGGVANVDSTGAQTILSGITIDNNNAPTGDGIDMSQDVGGTGSTMTLQGTINVNNGDSIFVGRGNFNAPAGTLNLTGSLTNAGGTATLPGIANITGSVATSGGTTSITGTATIAGNLTNSGGATTIGGTANLAGNFTYSGGTFTQPAGTVNFNGTGAQQITGGLTPTFFNLIDANTSQPLAFSNSANVNGTLTVNANAVLDPAATAVIGGSGTLTGAGTIRVTRISGTNDFLTQYTITNKTLTGLLVDYVGTALQGFSGTTYTNVRLNNASGANLSGNAIVNGTLTLQSGNLNVATNTLTLNSVITATSGTLSSAPTGTVNYNQGTNGQAVLAANYGNLIFSNFNKVLPTNIGIAGAFTPGTATGHTVAGNTITFNGTAAQTIPVFPYYGLTLSNAAGATLGGSVTVSNALTLTSGVLNVGTTTLTLDGSASQTGGSFNSAATGTVIYNQGINGQNVLSGTYGNLTFNNFNKVLPSGTITILGTFSPGTAIGHTTTGNTIVFSGNPAFTLPVFPYNNLTLTSTTTTLPAGTTTIGGALALNTATLNVGANTLVLNGAVSSTGGTLTSAATGTVNYNQASDGQAVLAANYGNLIFSNFNKVLPAATVGIAGAFTPGTATGHTVAGNTIAFNGTAAQAIPAFTFNNLTLNNAAGATMSGSVTVGGTLTLTNGAFAVGANTLTLNGAVTVTGGSLSAATGTVNYNQSSNGQAVLAGNYGNLIFSNFNKVLPAATVGIAGTFTPGTAVGHTVTNSNIIFNGTAAQTIPVFPYFGLTLNNSAGASLGGNVTVGANLILSSGVLSVDANTLTLNGSVTATTGNLSAASGTVVYNQATNGQAVLAGNYGNLTFSNFTKVLPTGNVGVAGVFTPGTAVGHTVTGNTFIFNGSGAQTIPAFTYNNLSTATGGVKTTSGAVNAANATVAAGTTLVVAAGSTLTVTGTLSNSGTIQGTGTIVNNFNNGGTLAPGLSPGILSINGNFTNSASVDVEIGGTAGPGVNPNGHDEVVISGTATLGGTLNVSLTNGFTPAPGNTFVILDASSLAGTFATENLPDIMPNRWNVGYNNAAGTVTLTVLAPTAAAVAVAGRVVAPDGSPITRASVVVTDANGASRSVLTNQFGNYRIDGLVAGGTYTVSVAAKSYTFAPRVVSVADDVSDLDFVGEEAP